MMREKGASTSSCSKAKPEDRLSHYRPPRVIATAVSDNATKSQAKCDSSKNTRRHGPRFRLKKRKRGRPTVRRSQSPPGPSSSASLSLLKLPLKVRLKKARRENNDQWRIANGEGVLQRLEREIAEDDGAVGQQSEHSDDDRPITASLRACKVEACSSASGDDEDGGGGGDSAGTATVRNLNRPSNWDEICALGYQAAQDDAATVVLSSDPPASPPLKSLKKGNAGSSAKKFSRRRKLKAKGKRKNALGRRRFRLKGSSAPVGNKSFSTSPSLNRHGSAENIIIPYRPPRSSSTSLVDDNDGSRASSSDESFCSGGSGGNDHHLIDRELVEVNVERRADDDRPVCLDDVHICVRRRKSTSRSLSSDGAKSIANAPDDIIDEEVPAAEKHSTTSKDRKRAMEAQQDLDSDEEFISLSAELLGINTDQGESPQKAESASCEVPQENDEQFARLVMSPLHLTVASSTASHLGGADQLLDETEEGPSLHNGCSAYEDGNGSNRDLESTVIADDHFDHEVSNETAASLEPEVIEEPRDVVPPAAGGDGCCDTTICGSGENKVPETLPTESDTAMETSNQQPNVEPNVDTSSASSGAVKKNFSSRTCNSLSPGPVGGEMWLIPSEDPPYSCDIACTTRHSAELETVEPVSEPVRKRGRKRKGGRILARRSGPRAKKVAEEDGPPTSPAVVTTDALTGPFQSTEEPIGAIFSQTPSHESAVSQLDLFLDFESETSSICDDKKGESDQDLFPTSPVLDHTSQPIMPHRPASVETAPFASTEYDELEHATEPYLGEADATAPNLSTPLPLHHNRRRESQILGVTPSGSFGFDRTVDDLQQAHHLHEIVGLCVLCLEVHVASRRSFVPDPAIDAITFVVYSVCQDACRGTEIRYGAVICQKDYGREEAAQKLRHRLGFVNWNEVSVVTDERELLAATASVVQRSDPDILVGFDIQRSSWGYLLERASALKYDLCPKLSRVPQSPTESRFSNEDHWWSLAELQLPGRIVLNLWRVLRHEVTVTSYSFQSVVYHLLHCRCPEYSFDSLTEWYGCQQPRLRRRVVDYFRQRVELEQCLLTNCDILNRTAEMARLYGIQFYDVLSRGSQYRVESMMLRMTRKEHYVAPSPSPAQRNLMPAPECIALTLEPESMLYTDPVLVLDFQSLYPSMIIAYNYCYSTCLGKVKNFPSLPSVPIGCLNFQLPFATLENLSSLENGYHISPAGVAFVTSKVRQGILPRMLNEILETRIMVKQRMKVYKDQPSLHKLLDARQLALKLIANVTYGYTSANYSGRMPCVEIADSIVHKGRETLEAAIQLVHSRYDEWGGRVVYGDTDSMFVHLRGKTKEQAFDIGEQIAATVTQVNPSPVKLKFEKVFYPCLLETKKRYVGYSYEHREQAEPTFDAKGIETVRRDGCPAVAKILEKSLRILFDGMGDVLPVRRYVTTQFAKILRGTVNAQDFVFAKEYRGRAGYRDKACVPALTIARARTQRDPRAEPRNKERVPYVIVNGSPNCTLISCVREPHHFLFDPSLRLNFVYYITGQIIPALNRALTLLGQDAHRWYAAMPRRHRHPPIRVGARTNGAPGYGAAAGTGRLATHGFGSLGPYHRRPPGGSHQPTIAQYFHSNDCVLCGERAARLVCSECQRSSPTGAAVTLHRRAAECDARLVAARKLCAACTGEAVIERIRCVSLDCPLFFRRTVMEGELENAGSTVRLVGELYDAQMDVDDELLCW